MEKFTTWRDKGTGISPFMPVKPPIYSAGRVKYLKYPLKALVFLVKAPVIAILLSLYYITSIKAILNFALCTVIGLGSVEILADGVKRSQKDKLRSLMPRSGDLVVVNYTSPISGLVLALTAQSSWRNIAFLVPSGGELYEHSVWTLFGHAFTGKQGRKVDVRTLSKKTSFLLIEGTPSNGKAVLPFQNVDAPDSASYKLMVMKLPQFLTLPVPYMSKARYIFELLSMGRQGSVKAKVYELGTFAPGEMKKIFELNGLSVMEERLSVYEKARFWEMYRKI